MMTEMIKGARHVQLPLVLLGAWLATSPFVLGTAEPTSVWNDVICGIAVAVLAIASLAPRGGAAPWINALVGIWLLLAPLAFWTESPMVYANDTVVGALVIGLAVIEPMRMPMHGSDIPAGWSYNPSTWQQRIPIVALGFASFLMARYMAAFQLGHIDSVWEPFFGDGTRTILTSDVSRAWPISDAGLGAVIYLIETLSTLMGDRRRWRTMPWMVAIFAFAVIPLGIVSIILVIMQPLVVGAWCTLCLVSAAFMLLMIPLSLDEVVAMVQFVVRGHREGRPWWRTFFYGGEEEPEPALPAAVRPSDRWSPAAAVWGVGMPWNLVLSIAAGAWLMAAPAFFAPPDLAGKSDQLVGALVVTVAAVALADVGRVLRYLDVPLALWLAASPFVFGATGPALLNDVSIALVLLVLAFRRGPVRERYGYWHQSPWSL